jgi:hypothetical protein
MRVLAFSSLVTAALGDAVTFTPANIMNKYDFLKAEITSMDYTRQICPKSNVGSLPECLNCYEENTWSMSMVGFESRVARHNPADPVDLTGPTTVLMASFIGAPTFIVRLHSFFFFIFLVSSTVSSQSSVDGSWVQKPALTMGTTVVLHLPESFD